MVPRTGRPQAHRPEAVLDVAHLLIPDQAAALGVSHMTIKRMWGRLKADGVVAPDDVRLPSRGRRRN